MIVNAGAPPFDKPGIRKAMALALDRGAFNTILAEGNSTIGMPIGLAPAEAGRTIGMVSSS
jgi:ABC-type transport system substrate-binding protein